MSDGYFRCSNGCQCTNCMRERSRPLMPTRNWDQIQADIDLQHVTAERDTAKEIIKELVSAAQGLAASRTYNPEILRDLLARAKELLK